MEYINKVEISGKIGEIRKSEKGSCFIMLKQLIKVNDIEFPRSFEIFVDSKNSSVLNAIKEGLDAKFSGSLTVFRIKGTKYYKIVVNASSMEIIKA